MRADDPGIDLPLHGTRLIEASAGTGKTFTLATLYTRLVIERRLEVDEILAVTYTEAATRELRERLRQRLLLAWQLATQTDPFAVDGASAEARITATLIAAAQTQETPAALATRLERVVAAMDLAPIHTIHGFCRRALSEYALEAGQPLAESELLANQQALEREAATDFWRLTGLDAAATAILLAMWSEPRRLASDLREWAAIGTLLPVPASIIDNRSCKVSLQSACAALATVFAREGAAARVLLHHAAQQKIINGNIINDGKADALWRELTAWAIRPRETLNKSILDFSECAESGPGPYSATPNQALTCLIRGEPSLARGTSELVQRFPSGPLPEGLEKLATSALRAKANKGRQDKIPASPLFDAIEIWVEAKARDDKANAIRRIALIHQARDYFRTRLAVLKRERGVRGFDDLIDDVAKALDGTQGERFAAALRRQYRVALVDEFQDTDARQWAIFHRLFAGVSTDGDRRALFLIGDPKQAIYRFRGGDVHAYLAAAAAAGSTHPLDRNFRSRPCALAALEILFSAGGNDAFIDPRIRFSPVQAGGTVDDGDFICGNRPAPGLTFLRLSAGESGALSAEGGRTAATLACVNAIWQLLLDGRAGRARLRERDGQWRAVRSSDIAILVEQHADGQRIHAALAEAGIAAVAANRNSLFNSEEAQDLRTLLDALLMPGDSERWRAALATPLIGLDAAQLATLARDEPAQREWLDRLHRWRECWRQAGVLALLSDLAAGAAPRLLSWNDGERRLTNYLQLGEALAATEAGNASQRGLLDWLETRIAEADADSEEEWPYLPSDNERVRILTLHASKGLEFPIVFLPYAATGGAARPQSGPKRACFHNGSERVIRLALEDDAAWAEAEAAQHQEQRAERVRLLYVGLTRARCATYIAWGNVNNVRHTALAWLLQRYPGTSQVGTMDDDSIDRRLAELQALAPRAIAVTRADLAVPQRLPAETGAEPPPAAIAQRSFDRDWGVYSFSQLARAESGEENEAGASGPSLPPTADSRFGGARFGNSLHYALEFTRPERWRGWRTGTLPAGEREVLQVALDREGYVNATEQAEGIPLLAQLVGATLNARLPEGIRLCDLSAADRRNELAFDLALQPTALSDLLHTLHAHGIVLDRQAFGTHHRIEGLLTGRIDLVYRCDGRFFILDYKSNRLPDYGAAVLAASVREQEYDLQYTLYTLALHRWLRFRLGARYNYDEQAGGVRYLYCRGLDPDVHPSPGIYATTPPRALIEALDALFGPPAGSAS